MSPFKTDTSTKPLLLDMDEVRVSLDGLIGKGKNLSKEETVSFDDEVLITGCEDPRFIKKLKRQFPLPPYRLLAVKNAYFTTDGYIRLNNNVLYNSSQISSVKLASRLHNPDTYTNLHCSKLVLPLFGQGDHIYGHWLVDFLPRYLLAKKTYPDLSIVLKHGRKDYVEQLLTLLFPRNLKVEFIEEKTKINCSQVVHAPSPRKNQVFHSIFSKYVSEVSHLSRGPFFGRYFTGFSKPSRKIFLSRGRLSDSLTKRQLLNRREVETAFSNYGYEVIHPEKLSLKEQIELFNSAKVIAGEDGSALHNSLFMPSKTTVINLRNSNNHSLIQHSLCTFKKQKIAYIFGHSSIEGKRDANYKISVLDLDTALSSKVI